MWPALLLVPAVALGGLWAAQRRLVYLPDPRDPGPPPLAGAEDVRLTTSDGLTLRGWFVPATRRPSGATVLVCNGNAGNRAARAPLAAALVAQGMAVLLFDYRGYGGSPGRPSEEGLRADARAARRLLVERADVDAQRLVYFGESIGAAVALDLAADHPPAAVVLRSPFTSLADVGRLHYPLPFLDRLLWDRFDAAGTVARVRSPLLVVAGADDGIVPPAQSRALYEAASGPKRYVEIPGADHNDPALLDGPELVAVVTAFVAAHAGG